MPISLHARGLVLALGALAGSAHAFDRIEFSFDDPAALYSAYHDDIQRSTASAYLGTNAAGLRLFEQGAAHEVNTGVDSNGAAADIEFTLGVDGYLQQELWFDPSPGLRASTVPLNQTDAYSVLQHGFGHAFGFKGWRYGTTGALPGDYLATFDALVTPLDLRVMRDPGLPSVAAVPEPAAWWLWAAGLCIMVAAQRRRSTTG